MAMLPPKSGRKYAKGPTDHVDSWLISYSDLITLLFMVFVMIVSITVTRERISSAVAEKKAESANSRPHSGAMAITTPYDDAYRNLIGIVTSTQSAQDVAVEKVEQGVWIDVSAAHFFAEGSAKLDKEQLPLLRSIAHVLRENAHDGTIIEVEGHTDDAPPADSIYENNWDLAAARAAHIVNALVELGVNPAYLKATSRGGMAPAVPNRDSAGQPIVQNREHNQRMIIRLEQVAVPVSANRL